MIKRSIALLGALALLIIALASFYRWFEREKPESKTSVSEEEGPTIIEKLDRLYSDKRLGAFLDTDNTQTVFRIFAPRSEAVDLCLYDSPEISSEALDRSAPSERIEMHCDEEGVWQASLSGIATGRYYRFRLIGPGNGEQRYVGDPYARAIVPDSKLAVVVQPQGTNQWFRGWSETEYTSGRLEDMLIYATTVESFTGHPSSSVPSENSGKFAGIADSLETDAGVTHLLQLGANAIELKSIAGGDTESALGCPFSPKSLFGTEPIEGSQYYELKEMVAKLHREGVRVIATLDYGKIPESSPFVEIDRTYYTGPQSNEKGTGKAQQSYTPRFQAPMLERMIIDNVKYWLDEFHLDGIRLKSSAQLPSDLLRRISNLIQSRETSVGLILDGESASAVNSERTLLLDTRIGSILCDFAGGENVRESLIAAVEGKGTTQTGSVSGFVISLSNADLRQLISAFEKDAESYTRGLTPDSIKRNNLVATALLTLPGVPRLQAGQEFLSRSITVPAGDYALGEGRKTIDWDRRRQKPVNQVMRYYRGIIRLRNSRVGRSIRNSLANPRDCEFILPSNTNLLGYRLNAAGTEPGSPVVVLMNSSERAVYFPVEFSKGEWRLISDGNRVDPRGLPGGYSIHRSKEKQVLMPALSCRIFVRLWASTDI